MFKMLKQARAAVSLLNPEEARHRAEQPVHVGLVAADDAAYREIADILMPLGMAERARLESLQRVHRADDPNVPASVDLVLYQDGIPPEDGSYSFDARNPAAALSEILDDHRHLALPLARQFPVFRKPVIDSIIRAVARENALSAIATALPNIVPNVIELPWAFGEFASDTAFLTSNQIRMAFQIAAACGRIPGYSEQKGEILSIVAGAFGWRALARELVGHIPLGGGLIPKGAIAWAGTFAVGKSLEFYNQANRLFTPAQRAAVYRQALPHGKQVAESLRPVN
jgi:hypothetical protein